MKTLSIRQPWAILIAQGDKIYEIRSWAPKHRGPLLIHAGLKPAPGFTRGEIGSDGMAKIKSKDTGVEGLAHFGYAFLIVDLISVEPFSKKHETGAFINYAPGLYAWELKNPRQLIQPIPMKGQLGIFETEIKSNTYGKKTARIYSLQI